MTGCTTPEPRGTTASGTEDRASVEEGTSADGPTITQSPWHLVVLYDSASGASDPLNEVDVTARFSDDGRVTGRSGCHRYTANYEVSGDSLAIGPAATPAGCVRRLRWRSRMRCLQRPRLGGHPRPVGIAERMGSALGGRCRHFRSGGGRSLAMRTVARPVQVKFDRTKPIRCDRSFITNPGASLIPASARRRGKRDASDGRRPKVRRERCET